MCVQVCMGVCGYVRLCVGMHGCAWVSVSVHGCARVFAGVDGYSRVYAGVCGCAQVCAGVWDEFSEFLLENRVPTSADFNTYPIRIFSFIPNIRYTVPNNSKNIKLRCKFIQMY